MFGSEDCMVDSDKIEGELQDFEAFVAHIMTFLQK